MTRKWVLLTLLAIFLPSSIWAASIGVTPGYIDYGEVQPGDSIQIDFYITTSQIDQEFRLNPEYKASLMYALGDNAVVDLRNVSEQDIGSWIEFRQDSFTIDPATSETYQLPDGTNVNAEGRISFTVDIPANTEPGYRLGTLDLDPSLGGEGGGAGTRVVARTVPNFAFRVPGQVNRNIELVGTEAVRTGQNRVQIINQLRNTGTVTTTLVGGEVGVFDDNGRRVGAININSVKLEPGEFAEVDDTWIEKDLSGGEYSLEGQGDYRTGEMYVSDDFVVTDTISERRSIDKPSAKSTVKGEAPLTLILILSLLIGTVLYLLDASFIWVLLITGTVLVSLYILLSSVSAYLLLIPLTTIAVMLYL